MISIIIPTLQEEGYIGDTVRQFTALALPHEVIVSDGRSTDKTIEEARNAGAKIVECGEVRTPSHQRNGGARAASGAYFVFVDSSVRIPSVDAFLRKALAHFEGDERVVGLAVPQWIYPETQTRLDRLLLSVTNFTLKKQKMGSGKFVMTRRSVFERLGGFREDLVTREDGDFFLRLKEIGDVVFDSSLPVYYAGRREHKVGWLKLLWIWILNDVWVKLYDRAYTKEWTPVR